MVCESPLQLCECIITDLVLRRGKYFNLVCKIQVGTKTCEVGVPASGEAAMKATFLSVLATIEYDNPLKFIL
jgi:hypothetical protein